MSYSKMAHADSPKHIVFGAAILATDFTPSTGTVNSSDILGLTTGGNQFNSNPTFQDFASDADQLPENTMEFKQKQREDPAFSGTFIEMNPSLVKRLMSSATVTTSTAGTQGTYTVTVSTALAAGDSVVIGGTAYTYSSSATTASAQATAIAAAVTADTSSDYSASASEAVVTLTEKSGHYGAGTPEIDASNMTTGSLTVATTTEGAADVKKLTPNAKLTAGDFFDAWLIGDTLANGFLAIHVKRCLNTVGFQPKTTKDGKTQFAYEFHGHYSLSDTETPPYEIYYKDA